MTYTTPVGVAFYPYIFVADTKFDANGVYNVKLRLDDKESKTIIDVIEKEIAQELVKNKSTKKSEFKPYKKVEGGYEFHFKLKAKNKTNNFDTLFLFSKLKSSISQSQNFNFKLCAKLI